MAQVTFCPRGPGEPELIPGPPAAGSVGDRLIPNSTAWRDRYHPLWFRSGSGVAQRAGEDTSDGGWEAEEASGV